MKIAIFVLFLVTQALPCCAHEGHDKAFANKHAMVATNQKVHIAPEGQAAIGLKTAPVHSARLQTTLEITGKVEPADNRVNFVTSPVSGIISRIDVQEGANVRKGQLLAVLYSAEVATVITELLDQRAAIQADITKAEVQAQNDIQVQAKDVAHLTMDLEREQKLLMEGITARKNYVEAVHALDVAKARLEGTRRQLSQNIAALESRRSTTTDATKRRLSILGVPSGQIDKSLGKGQLLAEVPIFSPATGTVFSRDITQGENVDSTRKLLSIVNLSPVWISLDVHPDQLSRIKLGQPVRINSPVSPETTGTISSIASVVDPSTRTVHVRVVASNPNGTLRPEMFVTASIVTGKQSTNAIVVPAEAIVEDGGRSFVYVKYGDDFQAVAVRRGAKVRDAVEILDGLYEGDQVVVNGATQLRAQSMLEGKNTESESTSKHEIVHKDEAPRNKGMDQWLIPLVLAGGILLGLAVAWIAGRVKGRCHVESAKQKAGSHE
jgi:cobalt-zinc-cadmium efflux system membrane fusion protein